MLMAAFLFAPGPVHLTVSLAKKVFRTHARPPLGGADGQAENVFALIGHGPLDPVNGNFDVLEAGSVENYDEVVATHAGDVIGLTAVRLDD